MHTVAKRSSEVVTRRLRVVPQMAMAYKRAFARNSKLRAVLGGAPLKMLEVMGVVSFQGSNSAARKQVWERWLATYIKGHSHYFQNVGMLDDLMKEVFAVFGELEHRVWSPEMTEHLQSFYSGCTFTTYSDGDKTRLVAKIGDGGLAKSAAMVSSGYNAVRAPRSLRQGRGVADTPLSVNVTLKLKGVFDPCSLLNLLHNLYNKKFTGSLVLDGREDKVTVMFRGGQLGRRRGSDPLSALMACMEWPAGSYRLNSFDVPSTGFLSFGDPMLLIYRAYTQHVSPSRVRQKLKSFAGYTLRPTRRIPEMLRVMGHACPLCAVLATVTDDIPIEKILEMPCEDERVQRGALLFALQAHMLIPASATPFKYPAIVYNIDDGALV